MISHMWSEVRYDFLPFGQRVSLSAQQVSSFFIHFYANFQLYSFSFCHAQRVKFIFYGEITNI